jgi:Subtilase family
MSPDGNPNGGPGSCAQCIEAPGAATAALTVGAISDGCDFDFTDPNACPRDYSGDDIPYFSSTGPRLGDFAIKPEITAPGVDIPSALASGTGTGTPVGAYPNLYTYLSGTSMATPMVAGSAAILLGEHPDWTAQQLRDALTSTATPNPSEPEYWQGSGMVNVGKAATQAVFGTGDLNLGTAAYPQQPGSSMLTGTITYTNTGSAAETLSLSSSFATAPSNFGFEFPAEPWTPPTGVVSLPGQVTVPAGGSQAVQLSIDASQAPYFSTYGLVTATAADGSIVRTTVGFTRSALTHRLTLTAIDQTGTPETTNGFSYGYLMDLTNGQLYGVSFTNGDGTILGTRDNQLIAGREYAFLGQIATFGPAPYYHLQSWTQLAEPQITMNADQSFTFDARNAGLVSVGTQRPSVSKIECSGIARTVQVFYLALQACGTGDAIGEGGDIYTLGGGQATTGTFQHVFTAYREQAPIAVMAHGLAASLLPQYSRRSARHWHRLRPGPAAVPGIGQPAGR